jgi:peptide subunit release factor 1 (eRF1)
LSILFRLKNWIAQQAEREQEAAERKRRKLERLREEPKHNFHDQTYEKERSQLTENVSDAVEKGISLGETILCPEIDIIIMIHALGPS